MTLDATAWDVWSRLDPTWRTATLVASAADTRQVHAGVAGAAGPYWPLRPLILTADRHRRIGALSDRLAGLVLAACRRRAADAGTLRAALGVPAERLPLLDPAEPIDDRLLAAARADVMSEGGRARFVEINIDGAVGGTAQADLLSRRFLALLSSIRPAIDGLAAAPSAVDARSATIRRTLALPAGSTMVIPLYEFGVLAGAADPADRVRRLVPLVNSAHRAGITAIPWPLSELRTDSAGRLLAGTVPVDAVLRLFIAATEPPSAGLTALRTAILAGTVRTHTSEASWLLGNKIVLSWLWDDLPRLDPPDQLFVRRHVPRTRRLGVAPIGLDRLLTEQSRSVLKPSDGHGGAGILLGASTSPEAWMAAVRRAADVGDHVLQTRVDSDRTRMQFLDDRTDSVVERAVSFVLGPFLFDRQPAGMLARHSGPDGEEILNAQRGSLLNAVLIRTGGAEPVGDLLTCW